MLLLLCERGAADLQRGGEGVVGPGFYLGWNVTTPASETDTRGESFIHLFAALRSLCLCSQFVC